MHISRKAFHATGIVIVLLYRGFDLDRVVASWWLWGVVALLALIDLVRAFFPPLQLLFMKSLRVIVDAKDERGFNGSTLYFAGCALAVTFFDRDAACGGILALAVGDSSAAIVGSALHSPRWGRVSLAGSGACFVFSTVAILLLGVHPWPVAIAGGVASALLEAFSGTKLDNLTMPVGVALVLSLLS